MHTSTFRAMERVTLALLTANVDKKCDFTRYPKHLLPQTGVEKYLKSDLFKEGKPPIDQLRTKLNANIKPGGATSRCRSLEYRPIYALRISPVNFILLESSHDLDTTFGFFYV